MKTKKIILTLILISILSCQNGKKDSETKVELKNQKLEIKSNNDSSENIDFKNVVFRNITELEKYKGFEKISAEVLSRSDKALVYLQKDSLKVLVLERIIKNSSPRPNYMILDEVTFISNSSEEYLALTSCELTQNPKSEIIFSLVKDEDVEYFEKIFKSWVIDLEKEVFREIESKEVKCYNIHYGYDG